MDLPPSTRGIFLFGPFRLDPGRRALLRDGIRIGVPAPLFDVLLTLVEHADRVVEGDEMLEAAWRGRAAEALSLEDIVAALRKLLEADEHDEGYISTAARGGYRFAAAVQFLPAPASELRAGLFDESGGLVQGTIVVQPRTPPKWRRHLVTGGVLALVAVVAGFVAWRMLPVQDGFAPPPQSIAVLAFAPVGSDPREQSIADGVSATLISSLRQVQGVSVASGSASLAIESGETSATATARRLGVEAVLEGNVRLYASRLRLVVRLSHGVAGNLYWTRSYDQAQGDLPKIERRIVADVTASLHGVKLQGPG
jgi:DNA-binding winged helix-turn-helix (wHTH) protein/TolB-like protein